MGDIAEETSFYNTTRESGDRLVCYEAVALSQEELVLQFFQQHPDELLKPSQIHSRVFTPSVPLTSVRRAITNLTKCGILEKTEWKGMGTFGRPVYCWRLNCEPSDVVEQQDLF